MDAAARLALLQVATRERRETAAERARELLARVDAQELQRLLVRERALTIVGPRVLAIDGHGLPPSFAEAVEQQLEAQRHWAIIQLLATERLIGRLQARQVRALPLKGAALSEELYGDPGRRRSGDIDILVHAADLAAAVGVVQDLGWLPPADPLESGTRPLLHFRLRHPGMQMPIEVHWRVHWYEESFAEAALRRAVVRGARPRLRPADLLAFQLLFFARDGLCGLRLLSDLSAWWDRYATDDGDAVLDPVVEAHPQLAPALATAVVACERLAGVPGARLLSARHRARRSRIALHVFEPLRPESEPQAHANASLIDALLTPEGGRMEFVRRQLLLSEDVLRHREPELTGRSRLRVRVAQLERPFRIGRRYAVALAAAARRSPRRRTG